MSYIGPNELIFNNDSIEGIHSGGFSVKSIMMKKGISPIMTLNSNASQKGGGDNVSDLFNDLVIPNWTISYNNMFGGKGSFEENNKYSDDDNSDGSDDDCINDELHNKLLDLVKYDENNKTQQKKVEKNSKNTRKCTKNNDGGTRKKKEKRIK